MQEDLVEYVVTFTVQEKISYTVLATDIDEAIAKAEQDANLDYEDAEYYDAWEK